MKKIYALALPALAITILSGCTAKKGSPYLMISEYIAGTNSDQAIEIYNKTSYFEWGVRHLRSILGSAPPSALSL